MQQWGAPPEVIEEWRKQLRAVAEAATVHVWPEHWHAVQLFAGLATQWQMIGTMRGARVAGLKYECIPLVERGIRHHVPRHLRMHRRRQWPVLLDQLRCLEENAMKALNKG